MKLGWVLFGVEEDDYRRSKEGKSGNRYMKCGKYKDIYVTKK